MSDDSNHPEFYLLPYQIIQHDNGVIIKRGVLRLELEGSSVFELVCQLQKVWPEKGATISYIIDQLPPKFKSSGKQLIDYFRTNNLLSNVVEKNIASRLEPEPTDVFYWHFGLSPQIITDRLTKANLIIAGLNPLSKKLTEVLSNDGVSNIRFLNEQTLYKPVRDSVWENEIKTHFINPTQLKNQNTRLLIGVSEKGNVQALIKLNRTAAKNSIPFLPVMLNDMEGLIGPLMIPGETSCLSCTLSSVNKDAVSFYEEQVGEGFKFRAPFVEAYHPAMLEVTANVTAFEISRYFLGIRGRVINHLIKCNLLDTLMTKHKIFRDPRCTGCHQ